MKLSPLPDVKLSEELPPLHIVVQRSTQCPSIELRLVGDTGGFHTQVAPRVALLWELLAGQHVGPGEVEPLQDGLAFGLHLQAHGPTCRDDERLLHHLRAHWRVEGAQEELEEAGAADLHERDELVHLNGRVLLVGVAHQVGHPRHVVAHVQAHGDGYGLTSSRHVRTVQRQPGHSGNRDEREEDDTERHHHSGPTGHRGHGDTPGTTARSVYAAVCSSIHAVPTW